MNNQKAFEELIKLRQDCTTCHHDDNLRHFDKILWKDGLPNLLSPWCPFGENSLDSEILIIGQDFGTFQYLEEAINIEGLKKKEEENLTNKKLNDYLKLANLINKKIYFTNAVLCIKNGESKKTKSGKSMSAKVESNWFVNCSVRFLKPLITEHLPNIKTIITLGKYALFSVERIVEPKIKTTKPFIKFVQKSQPVYISNKSYNLIPMLHPSFDHLSIRGHEKFKEPKYLWEDLKNVIANLN